MFTFVEAGHHVFCVNANLSVVLCLHNMVLELKLTRFHDQPWGFRLSGGRDFEIPLTVIKVIKGGIAESLGMRVGDIVVRVNETPTSNLNHSAAQEVILACGNSFVMALLRPDYEAGDVSRGLPAALGEEFEKWSAEGGAAAMPPTPDSLPYSDMSEMTLDSRASSSAAGTLTAAQEAENAEEVRQKKLQKLQRLQAYAREHNADVTDDQIAELLAGEAEVLKEHNVIGVNFQKIIPQAGLFKGSEVFKHLNAEAVKTKAEKEQELKQRWTTFLQKPDRPVPKSKAQIEMERRKANAYRIALDIPSKRAAAQSPASPTPPSKPEVEAEATPETNGTTCDDGIHCGTPPDESEPCPAAEPQSADGVETAPEEQCRPDTPPTPPTPSPPSPPKTEDELLVEKKLSDIQQQLAALSALPVTIQATLEAVTRQLSDLMPAIKGQSICGSSAASVAGESQADTASNLGKSKSGTPDGDNETEAVHEDTCTESDAASTAIVANAAAASAGRSDTVSSRGKSADGDDVAEEEHEEDEGLKAEEDIIRQRAETVFRKQEEEWLTKREKEQKRAAEEAARKRAALHPRRPSKAQGGPLTPQGRPVVLPGGRKWRNERDAFNEDFIAEVITSQAELIAGNALGVNFLKFKKPAVDLSNLDRSETFKIVHHIEHEPRHGIPVRAPLVLCEEDVRSRATPVQCV